MNEKYCSTCFKTGEELDAALQKALECNDNAERAEEAANRAESAVTEALAEAKASGEFDGEDGVTPHIGENGNWFIGETDTGVAAQGSAGGTDEGTTEQLNDLTERVGALEEQGEQTKETADSAYEISFALGLRMNAFETPPATVDLSAFESDGIIVETKPNGTQITYTVEFDSDGNPVKITDSNGHETVLTW